MHIYRTLLLILALAFVAITSTSCGLAESSYIKSVNGRISPTYTGVSESAYCSNPIIYSGSPVTITGNATYEQRESFDTGISNGLGSPVPGNAIRRAEIVVLDSNGSRVQCAETDENGDFNFQLPQSTSSFTIYINSRANNSFAKVSVLNMPEQNKHYSVSKVFTANVTKDIGNINAEARNSVVGAAFHILDLIVKANDFLRSEAGTCSADVTGCSDFTVADKVSIYWEKGFNPNTYFGAPTSGLSFYLPGFSRLFILGGINGDVDSSDTDHFDDTIIIHEYGHFLEDKYSDSDSPGGSHSGKFAIDPRLAFSEAWGNFFQAAVNYGEASTSPMYIDTSGNTDGVTSLILDIPLETKDAGCTSLTPGCDMPTTSGEGNFREFAITRALWDVFDTNVDGESVSGAFNEIWAGITNGNGFISGADSKFRDVGLLHSIQNNLTDGVSTPISDWGPLRSIAENGQQDDREHYAQIVTTGGSCGTRNFNINPLNEDRDAEFEHEFETSHLFYNNDFYHFKMISSGPATFQLNYLTSSGVEADLDLFIYNESADYGSQSSILGMDNSFPATSPTLDVESQTVNISNLPAGDYLINVKVKTHHITAMPDTNPAAAGGSTDYEILIGGIRLCP